MGEELRSILEKYIKDAETEIKKLETEITKAEAAGIDVSEEKKELRRLKDRIEKIKFVYLGVT